MNIRTLLLTGLVALCCSWMPTSMALIVVGGTTETACNGLPGNLFGICNAYCDAMGCENPAHKASDTACIKKREQWTALAGKGVPIPCENVGLKITKTAAAGGNTSQNGMLQVNSGDKVVYTITVMNSGALPLTLSALSDANIPAGQSCSLPAVLLPGDSGNCSYAVTFTLPSGQTSETVVNTASISAVTDGGFPVPAAHASVTVDVGSVITSACPCVPYWTGQLTDWDAGSSTFPAPTLPPPSASSFLTCGTSGLNSVAATYTLITGVLDGFTAVRDPSLGNVCAITANNSGGTTTSGVSPLAAIQNGQWTKTISGGLTDQNMIDCENYITTMFSAIGVTCGAQ